MKSRPLRLPDATRYLIELNQRGNSFEIPSLSAQMKNYHSLLRITTVEIYVRPPPISDHLSKTPKYSKSKPYSWNLS